MPFYHLFRLFWWLFSPPVLKLKRRDNYMHLLSAVRRMRLALFFMVAAVLIGIFGYRLIEHTTWFDAYYMSLVTLSTVGFGEVIPLSHEGRIFTSFLIIFNIGFFTYAVSTLTSIFADDSLRAFFSDYKMIDQIRKLRGHMIVCGYGRHATEVCMEFAKHRMPFVIIESDPAKAELLRTETEFLFIEGDATEDAILEQAGINKASGLIVTLPSDANNLFIVTSARQLNAGLKIISRLNTEKDEAKLRRAGADHVVMPERIGGFFMAMLANKPDLVEFFKLISNMGPSQVVFEEIPVKKLKPGFQGRSIGQSGISRISRIPIVAVRYPDGKYMLNPLPGVELHPEMHIVVLGTPDQIKEFAESTIINQE